MYYDFKVNLIFDKIYSNSDFVNIVDVLSQILVFKLNFDNVISFDDKELLRDDIFNALTNYSSCSRIDSIIKLALDVIGYDTIIDIIDNTDKYICKCNTINSIVTTINSELYENFYRNL